MKIKVIANGVASPVTLDSICPIMQWSFCWFGDFCFLCYCATRQHGGMPHRMVRSNG